MISFENKARIYNDATLQQQFNEDGYVIVDFLDEKEVKHLSGLFDELHPDGVTGFYTSTFAQDVNYRKRVDEEIQSTMKRGLEKYFFDYKVYCGSYIAKEPNGKGELILHQDMTLVDESIYTGTNIWIPLMDLNENNGAIEVLPKSHRLFKTYRGSSLPDIYDGIEADVRSLMKPCYLKAGQAIIFDQSIIHYSPPNSSDKVRPVVNTFVTHKDASIQICWWDRKREGEIELFKQQEDFMVNFQNFGHDIFSRPSIGTSVGYIPYNFPKITRQLLKDEYGFTWEEPKRESFLKRLFSNKQKTA